MPQNCGPTRLYITHFFFLILNLVKNLPLMVDKSQLEIFTNPGLALNNWALFMNVTHSYTYCDGSQSSPDCFIMAFSLSSSDASALAKSVIYTIHHWLSEKTGHFVDSYKLQPVISLWNGMQFTEITKFQFLSVPQPNGPQPWIEKNEGAQAPISLSWIHRLASGIGKENLPWPKKIIWVIAVPRRTVVSTSGAEAIFRVMPWLFQSRYDTPGFKPFS